MKTTTALALAACLWAPGAPAGATAPAQDEGEIERLQAWPELDKGLRKQVQTDITRLRKARTPEMGDQARAALVGVGAAIVPSLLPTLGKEKDEDAIERIADVLEAVTSAAHTRLLAKEFVHKSVVVRTWTMRRVASFPDAGIRAEAEAALVAVRKLEKKKKKKAEKTEILAASLVATSSGSLEGLEYLYERSRKGWKKLGADIRAATEAVRGPAATKIIAAHLEGADDTDRIAVLRVLAGCGDRETAVRHVKPFLDSSHAQLRVAAINALRGIVDGDPALDKLSAFDAIELAKKWKARV